MYLTDRELLQRLEDFNFKAERPDFPFEAATQIGPCSIDLRLSGTYWTPQGRRLPPFWRRQVTDLANTHVRELNSTLGWQVHQLKPTDRITLPPGGMILGRTFEEFQIPDDCAGAIEGRSSYSRLGLSVHTDGGFINPGWRGHMPLTLYNQSPVTLKIPVGTPLCQLLVVPLQAAPDVDYEHREGSKYWNDYGGPSLWWRDSMMRAIRDRLVEVDVESAAMEGLYTLLAETPDEQVLVRLGDYVASQGSRHYGNADELLDGFAERETRRSRLLRGLFWAARGGTGVVFALILTLLTLDDVAKSIWLGCIFLAVVAASALVWSFVAAPPYYLTTGELGRLRAARDFRSSSP